MKNNTLLSIFVALVIFVGIYLFINAKPTYISLPSESVATTTVETPATTTSQKISLQLDPTGLGGIKFGATVEEVVETFNRALGTSTKDTGLTSSFSEYGTCPGEQIRVIEWNRLRVFFGDTKFGTNKFFQYEYTDRDTKNKIPLITTAKGLTLNMSKSELQNLYPDVKITPWTENYEQYEKFIIDESIYGTLKDGKVFWINAGVRCGE